jgi:anti-sigma-K factor RskA
VSVQGHEMHLLTGSYALDALPEGELDAFERHLDRCPSCAEEVRGLRETAARLALATAVSPPPEMRARVLAAAPRVRQLPPARIHGGRHASRRRRPLARAGITASILALAAAVAFLVVLQVSTTRQLHQTQASGQAIAAVLAAPDAHTKTASVRGGGTVTVVTSVTEHEAVLTSADLPSLSGGRVYQLWVMNQAGTTFRSAGLLTVVSSGAGSPALASAIPSGGQLGITVEPAGGTAQPTTAPVLVLRVLRGPVTRGIAERDAVIAHS